MGFLSAQDQTNIDVPLPFIPGLDLDTIASFVLYGLGIGFPVLMCGLPLCCWWWRSQTWRFRHCWCFKRMMRSTGVDSFDDFDAIVSIHEAQHQNRSKAATSVRIRAGNFEVETDTNSHSNFQQTFVISVEQGTDRIEVDLLDSWKRAMATLRLDPVKDVLNYPDGVSQKMFTMKTKQKGVGAARITLTLKMNKPGDEERALLKTYKGQPQTMEVEFLLREQLRKADFEEHTPAGDQLHALAAACTGPVDYFSYFGVATPGTLAVLGPPHRRRWTLGFWKDPADFNRSGDVEVDLLRISSVQEDPGRSEVFVLSYADQNRVESRVLFRRTDRARDVWVHLLTMHISAVRDLKQQRNSEYMSMRHTKSKKNEEYSVRPSSSRRGDEIARTNSNVRTSHSSRPASKSRESNAARRSRSERGNTADSVPVSGGSQRGVGHTSSRRAGHSPSVSSRR